MTESTLKCADCIEETAEKNEVIKEKVVKKMNKKLDRKIAVIKEETI
jgi:DNA-directed RNA polymerase subunit M/transcription elongation factor TFIIS